MEALLGRYVSDCDPTRAGQEPTRAGQGPTRAGRGPVRVLDVGSLDLNGTYRPLVVGEGWHYTGLDLEGGPNVDVVAEDPYRYPFDDGAFDVVLSGGTMEHVGEIWRWVPELARLLRPGGMLAIVTHWRYEVHRHPVDNWRVLPDGMRLLFDLTGCLERYEITIVSAYDVAALGWKRCS